MQLDDYLIDIETAVSFAGRLDVTPGLVHQWRRGIGKPQPAMCIKIERITQGLVTRRDLRADWREIWPELNTNDNAA